MKGPDFPTGGQILNSADELREIYKTGAGTIRVRATWEEGPARAGSQTIYVTSIPYAVNKSTLVERIADVVLSRKLPPLLDVKDVSTDDVRIALELKTDADPRMVMAYLFKHTPLQTNFIVNLTCLIPTENPEVGRPERLDLKAILWHFLHFRLEVVTKRLEHELEALRKRIHILEGFEKVFDALDEIIRIIRKSDGKADAAEKIMKRFDLDEEQTDAILELKLYRLARLEILVIQNELADKRKRARQITGCSRTKTGAGALVREDIVEVQEAYAQGRQAAHADRSRRGGRVHRRRLHRRRRQRRHRVARRLAEAAEGSARPVDDAPARGRRRAGGAARQHARHGRLLHATSARPTPRASSTCRPPPATASRCRSCSSSATASGWWRRSASTRAWPARLRGGNKRGVMAEDEPPPVHAIAVTSDGYSLRFSFEPFVEAEHARGPPLRAAVGDGVEVVGVAKITGDEMIIAATQQARAHAVPGRRGELPVGPGQRRDPHQAERPTRTACSGSWRRPATATCCASKPAAAPSRPSAPRNTR